MTTSCGCGCGRRPGSAWPNRCGRASPSASTSRSSGRRPARRADRSAPSDQDRLDRTTLDPTTLFRRYLTDTRGAVDDDLLSLFTELVEEQAG